MKLKCLSLTTKSFMVKVVKKITVSCSIAQTLTVIFNCHFLFVFSSQDVIRQALITGNVPLAHAYLIDKSKKGSTSLTHDVNFRNLVGVGLGFVMVALSEKNIKQAISLLSQMVTAAN